MTTVTISGTIAGAYKLHSPLTVLSIAATGYVKGGAKYGVYAPGTATVAYAVLNLGRIKGGDYGIYLGGGGGSITNGSTTDTTATISGGFEGVNGRVRGGSVTNYGTITNTDASVFGIGVYLAVEFGATGAPRVVNGSLMDTKARIAGSIGISLSAATSTIENFGTVTSTGVTHPQGIYLRDGGTVVNGAPSDTAALIYGDLTGVFAVSYAAVTNYGTIHAHGGAYTPSGVYLRAGGSVTNGVATGSKALIKGPNGVVTGVGQTGSTYLTNFGTVVGTSGAGVWGGALATIYNGGTADASALIEGASGVTLGNYGSVDNFGTIIGQRASSGAVSYAGVITGNAGHVTNASTGLVEGVGLGVLMIGTLINFGTIEATAVGGYAVRLATGTSILEVEAGSTLIGKLNGGGGTLDLASGGGVILADGVDWKNFAVLEILSGAAFTATSAGTVASGGAANFNVAGTLDVAGALIVTDTLTVGDLIDGAGHLDIEGGKAAFNTGAKLTAAHVLVSGASTLVNLDESLIYAGAWTQTAGTASVAAGGVFKLTGAGDRLTGTATGAGIVELTGSGDSLKSLTLSAAKTEILAASATLSGVIDVTSLLTVTCPHLTISGITQFTGGGAVQLSNLASNLVIGASTTSLLENSDKIEGAGQLGGGQLRLTNEASGTILANGTAALVINTGTSVVANAGLIEASGAGGMVIDGAVANTGTLATHGGNLTVEGAVTGAGKVSIYGATASFAGAFNENVAFIIKGELALAQSQAYAGTISGFSKTGATSLDLEDISSAGATAIYSGTTTSGVLTVTDGTHTATIKFAGDYTASSWILSSDGHGGVLIVDPTASKAAILASAMASLAPAPASVGALSGHDSACANFALVSPRGAAP